MPLCGRGHARSLWPWRVAAVYCQPLCEVDGVFWASREAERARGQTTRGPGPIKSLAQ